MTCKVTHEVNSALRGPWLATSLSQSPKYWERPNAESVKAEEKENSGTGRGSYELRSFRPEGNLPDAVLDGHNFS